MDSIKHNIILTGVGAPGTKGTVYCIRQNNSVGDIIGTDMLEGSAGKQLVDRFYNVPPPESKGYIDVMISIVVKEKASLVLCQTTRELSVLSSNKGLFEKNNCSVIVNDPRIIEILNNKHLLLREFERIGLEVPRYGMVNNTIELEELAYDMGYPDNEIVVKLPVSNGMRGFRILSEKKDDYHSFMNDKPDSTRMSLKEFMQLFTDNPFPELLVMEYLPGEEYTVDCLCDSGEPIIIMPRSRDRIRAGITFEGTLIEEKSIIESCSSIISSLKIDNIVGFQYKKNAKGRFMILESNPRIQGTMAVSAFAGANIISGAIQKGLRSDISISQDNIVWGTRITRYYGGIIHKDGKPIGLF